MVFTKDLDSDNLKADAKTAPMPHGSAVAWEMMSVNTLYA
jgi:hypothetical protein